MVAGVGFCPTFDPEQDEIGVEIETIRQNAEAVCEKLSEPLQLPQELRG